ncbi:MAG TPA: hypothetical protein VIP80_17285 [Gemmatimonadales bacterium]|jgi:hypothetical protein
MLRTLLRFGVVAGAVGLGACKLEVINPNSPTTIQVKATPADLETFLGTQYRRIHAALYGTTANVWGMMQVQSFENFSTLSNNCQGQRVSIPRAGNDNSVGNTCFSEQNRIYFQASEVGRAVSDGLRKMDEGLTFGTPEQDFRNRAFAEFVRGLALGYLALVYDSAGITTPDDPVTAQGTSDPGELSHYSDVGAAAITAFDKAVDAATSAAALPASSTNFPLPSNWVFTTNTLSAAEFIKLVRSYRARIRANVARTPAERAAVNWDLVIADAQNGITADHRITTNTVTGPNNSWVNQWYSYSTWHQALPFIYGMADNSGNYGAWIATPLGTRGAGAVPFFMTTADQRFPQGADRAAQRLDFALTQCSAANIVCKRYFVNRDGTDPPASPTWGASQYDHARFYSWKTSGNTGTGQNGPFPFFTVAELNMLEAEGQIRKGNIAAAAALIDKTRAACGPGGTAVSPGCTARPAGNGDPNTGGGLPALTGVVLDATTPVPGGGACVPLVPHNASNAGGGTVACGNIFEAMKWEKRIETAYTHFGAWFFDSRGWGDLPLATPVDWAPPYEELQTRFRIGAQIYSVGGPNPYGGAAVSGYGW